MKAALLCLALVACSPSQRQTAINAAFATANAASLTLVTFVRAEEPKIVAGATDLADGQAKLAAFRAKVAKAELAIDTVWRAVGAAETLNTDQTLAALATAAVTLEQALVALGVKL